MSGQGTMLGWVRWTYVLGIPLLLLSLIVHKPFRLWGVDGYCSALTTPLSGYFFFLLWVRYPCWRQEVRKMLLGVTLVTYVFIWIITRWPFVEGGLLDETVWAGVINPMGIPSFISLLIVVSFVVRKNNDLVADQHVLSTMWCLVYGGLDLCVRSGVVYGMGGLYYLWIGRDKEAYLMLGSIFWAFLSIMMVSMGNILLTYVYAGEGREAKREGVIGKEDRLYGWLLSLFISVLLLTNIVTVRYLWLGHLLVTAGLLTYPFTFLLTDIISELYGCEEAEQAVVAGLGASIWMGGCTWFLVKLPSEEAVTHCYERFFSFAPGVILGSMVAYVLGQWLDVRLFALLKRVTKGRYLWLRNNVGTMVSQLVDTIVFGVVAWELWPRLGTEVMVDRSVWLSIVLNEYMGKVVMALLDTPVLYLSLYCIRRLWKGKRC